jgi:hypothetical protein
LTFFGNKINIVDGQHHILELELRLFIQLDLLWSRQQ